MKAQVVTWSSRRRRGVSKSGNLKIEPASCELTHHAGVGCVEGGKRSERERQQRKTTKLQEGQGRRMTLEMD